MPNRILWEDICSSADIDMLSPFEETVFYRLLVVVDDYGRIDARPNFLKSKLFVTKNGITEKSIRDALLKLALVGLVRFYEVDGKSFLYLPKWSSHQRLRVTKPKYPAPVIENEVLPQVAADCGELRQLAADCGLNPIQSESEYESEYESNPPTPQGEFDEFWRAYPKKKAKAAALKAWNRIKPNKELFEKILCAVELAKQSAQWKRDNGQYIPHPATWLNQGRWDDEWGETSTDEYGDW